MQYLGESQIHGNVETRMFVNSYALHQTNPLTYAGQRLSYLLIGP